MACPWHCASDALQGTWWHEDGDARILGCGALTKGEARSFFRSDVYATAYIRSLYYLEE